MAGTTLWTDEATRHALNLRGEGKTCRRIAALLSGNYGMGALTKNAVIGRLYRAGAVRHDLVRQYRTDRREAELEDIRIDQARRLLSRPDKSDRACRYSDCRFARHTGSDYCAAHHSEFIVARRRVNA